jgi:hypothetical protein
MKQISINEVQGSVAALLHSPHTLPFCFLKRHIIQPTRKVSLSALERRSLEGAHSIEGPCGDLVVGLPTLRLAVHCKDRPAV